MSECVLPPGGHPVHQLLVLIGLDIELVLPESGEATCHLGEHLWCEAAVLIRGELEEAIEAVAFLDRGQVNEVPRLGPPKYRKYFVDGELLAAQGRRGPPQFDREEPGIGAQVKLCTIV